MKLNLEHLAGYLPYGLKCHNMGNTNYEGNPIVQEIIGLDLDGVLVSFEHEDEHYIFSETFPILRPLSDLKRDDLFKMWSDHVDYLTTERESWIKLKGINKYVDELPYSHYKYLLKNHFDIYGLIDQNLAIDINTL